MYPAADLTPRVGMKYILYFFQDVRYIQLLKRCASVAVDLGATGILISIFLLLYYWSKR